VTVIPLPDLPGNDLSDGLLPCTVMIKSDGFLLTKEKSLLITFLITISLADGGGGGG
jgi:hypothetical protein